MSATAKVQARGQVTLPQKIRQEAGIKPGDELLVRVAPSGVVELSPMPTLTIDELVALYPIEGPIDEAADREAWQDEAAKDVFGR
jgi:AbrB family looped-hinge helix DNA binding protein